MSCSSSLFLCSSSSSSSSFPFMLNSGAKVSSEKNFTHESSAKTCKRAISSVFPLSLSVRFLAEWLKPGSDMDTVFFTTFFLVYAIHPGFDAFSNPGALPDIRRCTQCRQSFLVQNALPVYDALLGICCLFLRILHCSSATSQT